MMIIIIILTASYIGDDVRIVYSLANTMRSFSVTDERTNKGILGVGLSTAGTSPLHLQQLSGALENTYLSKVQNVFVKIIYCIFRLKAGLFGCLNSSPL